MPLTGAKNMIGIREENAETTLSNETEDSENMDSNSTAKSLVVYFFD